MKPTSKKSETGIKFIILCIGVICNSFSHSYSQKLLQSRKSSYYTYIYQITDKEAERIYKKDVWVVDSSFFHTLVDYYPTDSVYQGNLPQGHYLKTFVDEGRLKVSITSVQNFEAFIFNNNTDLCIRIYDLYGKIIDKAKVKAGCKKLRFNAKAQAYIDRKSNKKGLMKITSNGFTAYYNLARKYNNSQFKRTSGKVLYGTPLKYAWIPVDYVIFLPVDGIKSIKKGYPQGTVYRINNFFRKIASAFGDNYYSNNRFANRHSGYMVFNKPKYLPGDTVKFKAFLINRKGKALNPNINVELNIARKEIKLTSLKPYRKGAYEYEFLLHDSLKLLLDKTYYLSLERKPNKVYLTGSFRYEEYELSKNKISLRLDQSEQYRNQNLKLYVKGTDENDLNLLDARIEVLAKPGSVEKYSENHVFIPDTLLYIHKKLEPSEETEISIPDSAFPKVNMEYDLLVNLITSDNEIVSDKKTVNYFYESGKFGMQLEADSVSFEYKTNGITVPLHADIAAIDNFGNKTSVYQGEVPCKIKLEPYYASYVIRSDTLSEKFPISQQPSLIKCYSDRTPDSIHLVVDNPRKIPFSYTIYKRNAEKELGYTDSLNYDRKNNTKEIYYLSIRYLWGGKVKEENFSIPLLDKKLNIEVIQPRIVYPGQKTKIDILVTDAKGKPVRDVDVTAYSMTGKFHYTPPVLPYLGKPKKSKSVINNFHFKEFGIEPKNGIYLDYKTWRKRAGLDSIEYYKFIYPENSIYRFAYTPPDSITQFSPFVMWSGFMQPIQVIYLDSKPVYFSWSTNVQPYSFKVDSGYHQVKLRTAFKLITIDSVRFPYQKKLVFSLNENILNKNVRVEKIKNELSPREKQNLYYYIFPYRNTFGKRPAYLESGDQIFSLVPRISNYENVYLAGPVSGSLKFQLVDSFSTRFLHEPFFEYEFSSGILKMRSADMDSYPKYLYYSDQKNPGDLVLSKKILEDQWKDYIESRRSKTARYHYPQNTTGGYGSLLFNIVPKEHYEKPLNILVFRYDNNQFLRVYPGNALQMHQLEKGFYRLIFFYSGSEYFTCDSLYVKADGRNYYQIRRPGELKRDTFSTRVSKLIEETLFKPVSSDGNEKELKNIYNEYQQQFRYTGTGMLIDGYVRDGLTAEPLPGVNVIVKGTTYGTVTDIDGYFSINVPIQNHELVFSYIGYEQEEVVVNSSQNVNIILNPSIMHLDEVVVIGYGVQKKSSLTGSIATVSSQSLPGVNAGSALQGRVAGVSIAGHPGGGVEIKIRGASNYEFDKTPLYIINGNVFTGNISELDPQFIKDLKVIKGEDALGIYGARGANGVVVIETTEGSFKLPLQQSKGADYDKTFLEAASQANSIRNHFSDYAFWQPQLKTGKDGKASFEVTFPDDVTSWETFYLAMNNKRQSGQTKSVIKSYKPLMAELAVPRFLVESDTTYAIGKILNYTPDSMEVSTEFEVNGSKQSYVNRWCKNSILDTLLIHAEKDSLSVRYTLQKTDGYFDGEIRNVPVYPLGLEETLGNFYALDKDTTLEISFEKNAGEVSFAANGDVLDVMEGEIDHVIHYLYSCNEQIASKLKALLAEKHMMKFKGMKFTSDREVEKLIRLLRNNQKENGLWGWWKESDENEWISLHVLEALIHAESLGYEVKIDKGKIAERLILQLEYTNDFNNKVRMLKILRLLNVPLGYDSRISTLEKTKGLSLNGLLQILDLKQFCSLKVNTDTLKSFQKQTMLGNIYFGDDKEPACLLLNDVQNTLLAYRILRNDSLKDHKDLLQKIRNYFFENRKHHWQNTFESAQIIETILPDLLKNKAKIDKPTLVLRGKQERTIREFPFETKLQPDQKLEITKTGDFPVYVSCSQKFRNEHPKVSKGDFEITTHFSNDSASILKAGKETNLVANVTVKKDAEYVMINIPIPGGCSYADKDPGKETHREYFKDRVTIFCEYMPKGNYTFEVKLIPRYTGTYTLNPATVGLMYFPVFHANNENKRMVIW